jgi:steroid 5-alpha reductase family enzyme
MIAPFVVGLLSSILMVAVVFVIGRRIRNFGIVDVAWSWGFALLTAIYALMAAGASERKILLLVCVFAWSGRLGWHLYVRVKGHHPDEDGRYRQLREEWGDSTNRKMFWFYQLQAAALAALSAPFLLIASNPEPVLSRLEWAGAALAMVALIGEAVADGQLSRFKKDPANRGRTCRVGLWRYSRHPNYFFEWLVWVGFFVFALASPNGALTAACPLLMLYFLLRQTGIPATEEQALRTKGEDYRRYQQTTSAFVPWFPKKNKSL